MAWSLHITGVTWPGDRHLPLSPGIHEVPQSRWVQRGSCDRTYLAFVQKLGAPNSHGNLINVFPVKGGAALIFIIVSDWWQVFKLDHSNDLGFTNSPHFQTLTWSWSQKMWFFCSDSMEGSGLLRGVCLSCLHTFTNGEVCSPLKILSWPPKIGVPGVQMHLKSLPRTDSTIEWRTWRVQNGWETSGGKNKSCWKICNLCGFHSSFATGPSYSHYLGLSGNRVAKFTIIIHNYP